MNRFYMMIGDTVLEPTGIAYPESRLSASFAVSGVRMFLQAFEIKVENSIQKAADPEFEEQIVALGTVAYQDGWLETIEVHGRTYVLAITPYSQ